MDDPFINSNALINATAVWFLLKAVEVVPFAFYDVATSVRRSLRAWKASDTVQGENYTHSYDRTRGKLEYVLSGDGFFNFRLFRGSKVRLLISTIVPLAIFGLELMSIVLGNNTRSCETSSDMNVVSAPSLILFGDGARHTNFDKLFVSQEAGSSALRDCVTWLSRYSGVEFLSSMCGETLNSVTHIRLRNGSFPSHPYIGMVMTKAYVSTYIFSVFVQAMKSKTQIKGSANIGTHDISSEVLVNSRGVVHPNITHSGVINGRRREEIQTFVRRFEIAAEINNSTYFEDEHHFGFVWDTDYDYAVGLSAVIYAILAQSTRESIKPALQMSNLNNAIAPNFAFDISCRKDFILPLSASLAIVIVGVICRLLFNLIPTSLSSVTFALMTSEKDDQSSLTSFCFKHMRPVHDAEINLEE